MYALRCNKQLLSSKLSSKLPKFHFDHLVNIGGTAEVQVISVRCPSRLDLVVGMMIPAGSCASDSDTFTLFYNTQDS